MDSQRILCGPGTSFQSIMVQVSLGILVTIAVAAFFFLLERLTSALRDISDTLTEINESVSKDLNHIHNDIEGVEEQLQKTNNLLHRADARGDGGILGARESTENADLDSSRESTRNPENNQINQRQLEKGIESIIDPDSLSHFGDVGESYETACTVLSGATTDGKRIIAVLPKSKSARKSLHRIWEELFNLSLDEGIEKVEFRIGEKIYIKYDESVDLPRLVESITRGAQSEPVDKRSTTSESRDGTTDTNS